MYRMGVSCTAVVAPLPTGCVFIAIPYLGRTTWCDVSMQSDDMSGCTELAELAALKAS